MAMLGTTPGGAQVVSIYRAQNEALLKQNLIGISQSSAQGSLLSGLEIMKSALAGNDYESSPSTYLSAFRNSLQTFASTPRQCDDRRHGVSDASDLANSNQQDVGRRSGPSSRLGQENRRGGRQSEPPSRAVRDGDNAVKQATAAGNGRDRCARRSRQDPEADIGAFGISTVTRANNDTVIYTSGGTVLFETLPREVTFAPKSAYDATVTGNGIFNRRRAARCRSGADTSAQGKLAGLLQLRDDIAPKFQSQLDEMARGLVTSSGKAACRGSHLSGGTVPVAGAVQPGIAASLSVNPAAKANPFLLRDGGFNGVVFEPGRQCRFYGPARRIHHCFGRRHGVRRRDRARRHELDHGIRRVFPSAGSSRYAAAPPGPMTTRGAAGAHAGGAQAGVTGVSIDEELSLLLDLEQSYKASAKLISTVDAMMASLLEAVR